VDWVTARWPHHILDVACWLFASDIDTVTTDHIAVLYIDLGLEQLGFRVVAKRMVGLGVLSRDPPIIPDPPAKLAGD
jgi:hypothetical protein